MKGSRDFTERRQHERASVQNIVIGILNSDEPVAIGLINDISLGGVKYTHELRMASADNQIKSIDIIADSNCLMLDIPCECAWKVDTRRGAYSKLKDLRQCGIQFDKLNPSQIFLLKSIINCSTSLGTRGITSNVHMIYR